MRIATYISDLLYRYQCVSVPGFGSFLTQRQPAQVHRSTNAFYPPKKAISFNEQLQGNDGLLAKHISNVEGISFEDAMQWIAKQIEAWRTSLRSSDELSLENIGSFRLNTEGKLQFSPSQQINYLTESFGLASFVSSAVSREEIQVVAEIQPEREILKEEVEVLEEKTPLLFTPEQRKKRPYFRYAAAAAILITLGAFGFNEFNKNQQEQLLVSEQQNQKIIENEVQQATFTLGSLPSMELNVTKEVANYHVVGGAFRIEANADKKVAQLRKKGFEAELIGKNKYGLHQVSYASFSDRIEALNALRTIKRTQNKEAWLLVNK